jgi:hypothetical protein
MGKKAKEHRKKVEKRNRLVSQKKSAMQKAFDLLMKQQIERLKDNDGVDVSLSGQPLSFSVVDTNEELNINKEINIDVETTNKFSELNIEENKEEEE